MRFNKKASMELGISTVVVLVIAMVIIAGGIAFIRGFFKLGEQKLGGAFNIGDFGNPPTVAQPLILTDGPTATIKSGRTAPVKVGFYNSLGMDHEIKIQFDKCESTVGFPAECNPALPGIVSLSQLVVPGGEAGFTTYMTAKCKTSTTDKVLPPGEYICNLQAIVTDGNDPNLAIGSPVATTQITISVTS
ncbi:MAG: hypothetical protein ACP5N3_02530 [Candidatus Nanoarchaeia archaeon]